MIRDRAMEADRRLREIGFEAAGRNPIWYRCVVISMMVAPSRLNDIDERAFAVADALGWTIDRQGNSHSSHPNFHFGHDEPWDYYTRKVKTPRAGKHHTLDDIEPYCASHKRSWRASQSAGDRCTPHCEYGMRIR